MNKCYNISSCRRYICIYIYVCVSQYQVVYLFASDGFVVIPSGRTKSVRNHRVIENLVLEIFVKGLSLFLVGCNLFWPLLDTSCLLIHITRYTIVINFLFCFKFLIGVY